MLTKLVHRWRGVRASFWFTPASIVVGSIGLACAAIALDREVDLQLASGWSPLFGAGAAGSRGLLTAVATSMITVSGVVFSITIVALSLTSSQYTSRVLVNFMRDRLNQSVLGVFLGTFAYCLVVLRTIRGGDEGAFVPSLAVLLGLLLAFVGIGFLVYFIHHISLSIQASSVIAAAARETITAIDQLFPQGLGDALDVDEEQYPEVDGLEWRPVGAPESGYVESVDGERLLSVAAKLGTIVRMDVGIGEFVVESTALVSVAGLGDLEPDDVTQLRNAYVIGRHRTVQQDAEFGVRQIVDVALKALSPGINDSTTAVMCVDYLSAVLARLGPRRMIAKYRIKDEQLRLIARGPSFPLLVAEAFDQIRHSAKDNLAVLLRMLHAIRVIADQTPSSVRQATLRDHAELIAALARRAASSPAEAANVADSVAALARLFCVGLPNAR